MWDTYYGIMGTQDKVFRLSECAMHVSERGRELLKLTSLHIEEMLEKQEINLNDDEYEDDDDK